MTTPNAHSILIVEDERLVARDIQYTLRELGYDAFAIASSAEEAIACSAARRPDLVLMDIRIKGQRDGVETAEVLRTSFGVPVIYLTAYTDEPTLERAKKTEPLGYLVKPVRPAELRSTIEISLHKHEQDLRAREKARWLSTMLQSIADAVIAVDVAGDVTFMNPSAETLTGVAVADAIGRPAETILRWDGSQWDGDGHSRATSLTATLRDKRAVEVQWASLENQSTGTRRLVHERVALVTDQGEVLGAVTVVRDLTEQRSRDIELEVAERLVSLETLAVGVAHEVNSPLGAVVSTAAYMAEELIRHRDELADAPRVAVRRIDDIAQCVLDIQLSADRICQVLSDLLEFSNPTRLHGGSADVARCLEWAVRTTAHEFDRRARIVTRLGRLPRAAADEPRLTHVLIQLLINAAHAIPIGNVDGNEVTITAFSDVKGWIAIEIKDTGVGIPPEIIGRIFEPFFTTKPFGVGAGLGLSICHGIVKSFGGELGVESEAGHGTVSLVRLRPAGQQKVETEPPEADR